MSRRCRFLILIAALAGFAACARSGRPSRETPIVLISIDTLRADHLPAYGYSGVETPHLDALRRDSILFQNAYCQVPLTLPSHAVILTGLFPDQNGVRDNLGFRLSGSIPTLTTILKNAGYATGAAVSSLALRSDRGLDQGFDLYDDHFTPDSPDERAGALSAAVLTKWIDSVSSRPFFAFLHVYEPHAPYAPPEPFRSRYAERPYDGEIATADAAVGALLDYLKQREIYDRALIVFLSDHGEGLGDHGEDEHGVFLYREAIHVPLWLKLPGSRDRGRTVARPVGLVDVTPTVAAAFGLPLPHSSGIDLLARSSGEQSTRRIFSETLYPRLALGWSDLASLVDGRLQYIEAPRSELYDIASDPAERHDLAKEKPEILRSLGVELAKRARPANAPEHVTSEEVEKLGALGYLSVSRGSSAKDLPDPKDRIAQLKRYKKLFELHYARKDREAIPVAEEILAGDPQIASVWRLLSKSRERLGDLSGAARDLATGLEKCRDAPDEQRSQMLEERVDLLLRLGRRSEAEGVLRAAVNSALMTDAMKIQLARLLTEAGRTSEALALLPPTDGSDAAVLDARGAALAEAGQLDSARQVFLQALAKDPANAAVLLHLGMLSLREKDPGQARVWFEKSLASQPDAPATLSALGLAQVSLHDEAGALESWTKALTLDAKQYDTLFNLAVLAGRLGKTEEARHALQRFIAIAPPDRYSGRIQEARRLLGSLPRTAG